MPSIYDYWQTSDILHYSPIASKTPRGFFVISRYLHFADNSSMTGPGTDGYDRLGKVRCIVDKITSRF